MIWDYYKLREHPFGVTPDSRYLFMSSTHREALASLLYGIETGCGFLALIAQPGLGKTMLLSHAMNALQGEKTLTTLLFQTVCTPMDLMRTLLAGLGVRDTRGNLTELQQRLKETLEEQARRGKRVVVVIDEAQNLDDSVLELIRVLSNLETSREKLIQIIFSGQPQLAEKIGTPYLEQLRQRISIVATLKPFSREDTELYIDHRLRFAGYDFEAALFTRDALTLIAEHSDGIPRNINNLCFNSLSLACALGRKPIDREIVREVIADLNLDRFRKTTAVAPQSEEKGSQTVPAFLSAASTPSRFAGRSLEFALALAVILSLGGVLFASRRPAAHKAPVQVKHGEPPAALPSTPINSHQPAAPGDAAGQAADAVPPRVVDPSSATNTGQSAAIVTPESTVSVARGETLLEICADSFGKCDAERMQEIRKLNPRLNDPDHIESGQKIRLPASVAMEEEPGRASLVETNTQ